jgi:predicted enzyme related to lactoylglutathione lyase
VIVFDCLHSASNEFQEESIMHNTVVWFDIAVSDLDRAKEFYSKVFDVELIDNEMGPNKMSMFPFEPGVASGALVQGPDYKPSAEGATVYLNGGDFPCLYLE